MLKVSHYTLLAREGSKFKIRIVSAEQYYFCTTTKKKKKSKWNHFKSGTVWIPRGKSVIKKEKKGTPRMQKVGHFN